MSAYIFRPYIAKDLNFIRDSWGKSYYKGGDFSKHLSPEAFHRHHRPIRDGILGRPNLAIIVCASREDNDQLIGWIAVEVLHGTLQLIVHYVYVKQLYKGERIASELFERAVKTRPIFFSHMTDKALRILAKKSKDDFYYAPHLI